MDFIQKTDMGIVIVTVSVKHEAVVCKEIAEKLLNKNNKEDSKND